VGKHEQCESGHDCKQRPGPYDTVPSTCFLAPFALFTLWVSGGGGGALPKGIPNWNHKMIASFTRDQHPLEWHMTQCFEALRRADSRVSLRRGPAVVVAVAPLRCAGPRRAGPRGRRTNRLATRIRPPLHRTPKSLAPSPSYLNDWNFAHLSWRNNNLLDRNRPILQIQQI